jgi:hypothetical protein
MREQKSVPGYKMGEEQKQQLRAFLDLMSDQIAVLECLETNVCFFPDWSVKISEGIQSVIDYKQGKNIPCNGEKEALVNIGYFFTKMAYFSGVISNWRGEMTLGKKMTEEALDKM